MNDLTDKTRDPDLAAAETAIRRAAQIARQRAWWHGIPIAVWQNGRVIEKRPEETETKRV